VFAAQPGHHPGIHGPPGLSLVHGPHTPATVAALAGQQVMICFLLSHHTCRKTGPPLML
jgi:hypothetical protein